MSPVSETSNERGGTSDSNKLPSIVQNDRKHSPRQKDPKKTTKLSGLDSGRVKQSDPERSESHRTEEDRPRSTKRQPRNTPKHDDAHSPRTSDNTKTNTHVSAHISGVYSVSKRDKNMKNSSGDRRKSSPKRGGDDSTNSPRSVPKTDERKSQRKLSESSDVSKQSSSKNGQITPMRTFTSAELSDTSSAKSSRSDSRCSSSLSQTSTRSSSDKAEKQAKKRERREIRSLSKTVERKLTHVVNMGQRENSFSPHGVQTTTHKMMEYDLHYKLREAEMDKSARRKNKKETKEKNKKSARIRPVLEDNSTKMALHSQVSRLAEFANEVFDSVPVSQLAMIHRYRPHSQSVKKAPEHGNVQNYSCHIGSALHSQNYVDYYIKQGLQSGNKENSARLQRLPQKKESDDQSDKKDQDHENKRNSRERKNKPSSYNKSKQRYQPMPLDISHADDDTETYTDSFISETDDEQENRLSVDCDSDATTPRDQRSRASSQSRTRHGSRDSSSSNQQADSNANFSANHSRASSACSVDIDKASNYSYSNDFELDDDSNPQDQNPETTSTHTYISVEHAVDMSGKKSNTTSDRPGQDIEY